MIKILLTTFCLFSYFGVLQAQSDSIKVDVWCEFLNEDSICVGVDNAIVIHGIHDSVNYAIAGVGLSCRSGNVKHEYIINTNFFKAEGVILQVFKKRGGIIATLKLPLKICPNSKVIQPSNILDKKADD